MRCFWNTAVLLLTLLLSLVPRMSLASPYSSPGMKIVRADPLLVRAVDLQHRRGVRPRAAGSMMHVDTLGQVEVLSSTGKLALNTSAKTVTVSTTLKLKSHGAYVSTVYLLVSSLSPSGKLSVSRKGKGLYCVGLGNNVLAVSLDKALYMGETAQLTFAYSGGVDCSPSSFLSLVTCQLASPLTFNVGGAWQPLVVDGSSGAMVYPNKATLEVTVPKAMEVAGSGQYLGVVKNPGGTRTFKFGTDAGGVHSGNFSIAAAPYAVGKTTFGAKQQVVSHLLSSSKNHAGWRAAAADVLTHYKPLYGAYTMPRIGLAQIPDKANAAYGAFGAVFLPSTALAYDPSKWYARVTLAHELAHQWFGGYIKSGDVYSPWLAEGFATFSEMHYTSKVASKAVGMDYGPTYRHTTNLRYLYSVPPHKDVPMSSKAIYQVPSSIYTTVTYSKGALVVGMLRYALGDDLFFKGIRQYRADHAAKDASVAGLMASLVKAGADGAHLNRFFNRWVYSKGFPTYRVGVKRVTAGQPAVAISLAADRDSEVPVTLSVISGDPVTGKVHTRTLKVHKVGQGKVVTTPVTGEFLQVRFDPGSNIVGRSKGALAGDIQINGQVDGVDLIYSAWAQGQSYAKTMTTHGYFAQWADLHTDGAVDQRDLQVVIGSFGRAGNDS